MEDDHVVQSEVAKEIFESYEVITEKQYSKVNIEFTNPRHERAIDSSSDDNEEEKKQSFDSDGDIILKRKPKRRKRHGSGINIQEREKIVLYMKSVSTWENAGAQIWRASLLLAEYLLDNQTLIQDKVLLEMGCGIGFLSIVVSRYAKHVFATDYDIKALEIAKLNQEVNFHGVNVIRYLDWNGASFEEMIHSEQLTIPFEFEWKRHDLKVYKQLNCIIASDVFYDDMIAMLFLKALYNLMLENDKIIAYIAFEKRTIFSAWEMKEISLGTDTFKNHLCSHTTIGQVLKGLHNQYTCSHCHRNEKNLSGIFFVGTQLSYDKVPHVFAYERVTSLEIWRIYGYLV